MSSSARDAVAIVGVGAVLPDAPDATTFWSNVAGGHYSVTEVPADRWDVGLYYDPDPLAPDKTYSKIGGWVKESPWNPLAWKMPIPPRVSDLMDLTQKWSIVASRQALEDYGYPKRPLDPERTAVILGVAMGGDKHLFSATRILYPEFAGALAGGASFSALPAAARTALLEEMRAGIASKWPPVTEDTMPGELANIAAGRVAAIWDFRGPNFVTDAACASAMAAMDAAIEGLLDHQFDAVLTGGVDSNMSPTTFVKFSKIGALSATGSRPYADGADGFVMGEGGAVFLLKRLADAERDGDRVCAVILGVGGSSDGRGKGITAPNPAGQKLAVRRAWENAGVPPQPGDLMEGHGTSTRVGDVVEVESLTAGLAAAGLPPGSIALGSVKSNFGHLKGAAGAAGVLKAALALREKLLPPSLNFSRPNPGIDFARSPFYVNTSLRPWEKQGGDGVRRAGVSAFGFGGTNFHVVLEEHVPGRHNGRGTSVSMAQATNGGAASRGAAGTGGTPVAGGAGSPAAPAAELKQPLRGALVIGAAEEAEIARRLHSIREDAAAGRAPAVAAPLASDLRAPLRLAIDYGDAEELAERASLALTVLEAPAATRPARWKAARARGIYFGEGDAEKVAFLYTGQGSQYVNMLAGLRAIEPIVADTFAEADRVMQPLLGAPLTSFIFVDANDPDAVSEAEERLKQTEITQPAVLATDDTLTALLQAYGVHAEYVMGHSLGEYGALVAAGAMPFGDALKAVSARGKAMRDVSFDDNGLMAAVFGPTTQVQEILARIQGDVVIANINSRKESVIGGSTEAVKRAVAAMEEAGLTARVLPVSHAFHTHIVSPASEPLARTLRTLDVCAPQLPCVANLTGEFYPMHASKDEIVDILARQVGSPVQFVKGLETLYNAGARVFVEVGPKRALAGFADEVLGERPDVVALFTNHPKLPDDVAFNQALCGLYAAGHGAGRAGSAPASQVLPAKTGAPASAGAPVSFPPPAPAARPVAPAPAGAVDYMALGRLFAGFMDRALESYAGRGQAPPARLGITGVSLGLPGVERMFDDANLEIVFRGQTLIESIPRELRDDMASKRITRLVKSSDGAAHFETIENAAEVAKLAGRGHGLDLERDFGFPTDRLAALDRVTQIAIAAGIDALRDAGIPLVLRYKTTTKGTLLPERWVLPEALRDDTGVIFGAAFPGTDSFAEIAGGYYQDQQRRARVAELETLVAAARANGEPRTAAELDARLAEARAEMEAKAYRFDRRFLFRILSMGHSQFAEYIGARGPNTQINSACATGSAALAMAGDWIRAGRCKRVIVVTADDVTSDSALPWFGSGFVASGAAAIDERVEDAALPFDRRRHGLIIGMGGAALVVETLDGAAERGLQPICEILGTAIANSAFHGSRLNVPHMAEVMEGLIAGAEAEWGLSRAALARELVFVSHETYTPARGGSASAEVLALRKVFGPDVDHIVVANTKGYTGHPMAVAMEEVLAARMLETGLVPPVPNFREVDPELGMLNLSRGGAYPVRYVLRLGAGFGSQISMSLLQWLPPVGGQRTSLRNLGYGYRVHDPAAFGAWLRRVSGADAPELEVVGRTLRVRGGTPEESARRIAAAAEATTPLPAFRATAPFAPAPPTIPANAAGLPPAPQRPQAQAQAFTFTAPAAAAGAAPAPVPTPAPTPVAPVLGADPVREKVLGIVAEKTGYPPDMLDLDLDLEADLGIDTVKQAETFAAIRAAYDIPRDDSVKLRDYPTLGHAIRFVYDRRPDLVRPTAASAPAPAPAGATASAQPPGAITTAAPASPAAGATVADPVRDTILGIVAEKTGYPPDMLDLDLDLEADLGIDTVKQAETFAAIRAAYDIPREENVRLRDYPTLAHAISFVYDRRPDLARPAPTPAAAPAAVPAAAPAQPATDTGTDTPSAADPVRDTILAIVAEKTGYPPDMLDLDLDLEADLGIDTVKQAETFAAIRAAYDIPRDEAVKLRDYPTLAHAIRFVYDRRPDLVRPAAMSAAAHAAAPAPVAAPPREPQARAVTAAAADPVRDTILAIVARQTGYPPDMLDLDLDLEADLGVDTVKQAEMFAAIRAAYDIPRDDSVKLRDYPTLRHAVEFVYARRSELRQQATPAAAPSSPAATAGPPPAAQPAAAASADALQAAARVPRRIPVPRLRPALKLCKPTGVEIAAGSRVVVVADAGKAADALAKKLEKAGATVLRVDTAPAAPPADELTARLQAWQAEGGLQGVYWLPPLDGVAEAEQLSAAEWAEALRVRVKLFYAALRALPELGSPGQFVVAATRLGGRHGYDPAGAVAPLGGAVTGFTKTLKRERPALLVKAVDFEARVDARTIAARLVEETLADPGAVEVGHADGHRWTVGLVERAPEEGEGGAAPGLTLGRDTIFLVTGAAGSIVSAIVADLATASAGTFYLLDLTPAPDPADRDIARLTTDRDGLKRELAERLKAQGERPTPALIEKRLAGLERSAAALAAIQAVQAAGGKAEYRSVNLLDAGAVGAIVREVVEKHGGVDVLLHAAGMESSHLLPDKPPAEFDRVFDVKADGWHNLVAALGDARLGAAVVFSSVAARFGNAGQTDYASANDLLCKLLSHMRATRPATRALAIDWTGWEGIGMASRGSIPVLLKQAGLELLPPAEGVAIIRRELTAGGFRGEVVAAKALGAMMAEWDESGGLNVDRVPAGASPGPMTGKVLGIGVYSGLRVETPLDPTEQPFLFDHRIDETPVLPGVMGLEGMAEAAALLFGDRRVALLENVRFLAPFKFHRSRPRTVELAAEPSPDGAGTVMADCRVVGSRLLHGQTEPEVTTHFTARVRLSDTGEEASPPERSVPFAEHETLGAEAIYRVYFHGPAYRVLDGAWRAGEAFVGRFARELPPNHVPPERPLLIAPRLVELAFQTAGLAELTAAGRMGLPSRIERLELHCAVAESDGPFHAIAVARPDGAYDVDVVDGAGRICLTLRGYGTAALPGPVDTDALEPLRLVPTGGG